MGKWHIDDLITFVDTARGDDYKNFCANYAIYTDQKGNLHKLYDLKKNCDVNNKLLGFYCQVLEVDLKERCVDDRGLLASTTDIQKQIFNIRLSLLQKT